jgi:hypothetical protein
MMGKLMKDGLNKESMQRKKALQRSRAEGN